MATPRDKSALRYSIDVLRDMLDNIIQIRKNSDQTNNPNDFTMSVPEKGGSIEFVEGDTTIDFESGLYIKPDGTVVQLEDSLANKGFEFMSSFAIGADKIIRYQIFGLKRRIVDANVSDHISNIKFKQVVVSCDESTNIQVLASTHPNPVMGQSINYKIDDDGKQYVLAEGNVGQLAQCSHGLLRILDKYQHEIEHGEKDSRVGYRLNPGTGGYAIVANADFTQPTDDMQMEVVSDDVADDAGSTGAELVKITYFNKAWVKKTTDVIMNGTSTVNTTANDIYRIDKFEVTKGKPAVGTITLKDTGAVALYGQIESTATYMERCMFYIPTGKRCVVTDCIIGVGTNGGVIFRLFRSDKRENILSTDIVTRGRESIEMSDTVMCQPFNLPITLENPDGERFAMGLAVKAINANQRVCTTLRFYIEDI